MMTDRKRSAESGARLSVIHITIGKEYTVCCREALSYMTSLTHKTVVQFCTIEYGRTRRDDRVVAYHIITYIYAGFRYTHNGTFAQTTGTTDFTVVVNIYI